MYYNNDLYVGEVELALREERNQTMNIRKPKHEETLQTVKPALVQPEEKEVKVTVIATEIVSEAAPVVEAAADEEVKPKRTRKKKAQE